MVRTSATQPYVFDEAVIDDRPLWKGCRGRCRKRCVYGQIEEFVAHSIDEIVMRRMEEFKAPASVIGADLAQDPEFHEPPESVIDRGRGNTRMGPAYAGVDLLGGQMVQ
jgi:hypothetical protein